MIDRCQHMTFAADVDVVRMDGPVLRFAANVRIRCAVCGTPFRFLGLPAGLDLNGAAVDMDGTEGRFGIAPEGESVPPLDGPQGFTVRRKA